MSIPGKNPATRALSEAIQCLEPYSGDARFADLTRRLESLMHAYENDPVESDHDGEVAEVLADAQTLSKAEGIAQPIRERAERAAQSLALDHLHRMSPAGCRAYESRTAL